MVKWRHGSNSKPHYSDTIINYSFFQNFKLLRNDEFHNLIIILINNNYFPLPSIVHKLILPLFPRSLFFHASFVVSCIFANFPMPWFHSDRDTSGGVFFLANMFLCGNYFTCFIVIVFFFYGDMFCALKVLFSFP